MQYRTKVAVTATLVLYCTVSEIRWFIGRKIAKIASSYPPQSQKSPSLGVTPINFVMSQIFLETRMFWLSDGEEIMTLTFFVLIQYRSVTDRRTDIPRLAIPAVCIARYANALVKNKGPLTYADIVVKRLIDV